MTRFESAAGRVAEQSSAGQVHRRRAVGGGRSVAVQSPIPVPVLAPVVLFILALAGPPALPAQAENGWIGTRVVQKYPGFQLRIENQAIDPKLILTYVVEQANGPWLWLKSESEGISGWAAADQVVPVEDAIAFFTDYIRANPGDDWGYLMRSIIWLEKKEIDIALGDLNEAIRLDPTGAYLWHGRGNAWQAKKEYDRAAADYGEAIRLDPKNSLAYMSRGLSWWDKKEYDRAAADYGDAIRLDPKNAHAYYGQAMTLLLARRKGAADSARAGLEAGGWRGYWPIYTVIVGHLAALQAGDGDRAKALLDSTAARCDRETWPYPIVRHLRGELDEPGLLAAATDDDKRTEAHNYVGIAMLLKGRKEAARKHFEWVKKHGVSSNYSYTIAMAELERLEEKPRAAGRP